MAFLAQCLRHGFPVELGAAINIDWLKNLVFAQRMISGLVNMARRNMHDWAIGPTLENGLIETLWTRDIDGLRKRWVCLANGR